MTKEQIKALEQARMDEVIAFNRKAEAMEADKIEIIREMELLRKERDTHEEMERNLIYNDNKIKEMEQQLEKLSRENELQAQHLEEVEREKELRANILPGTEEMSRRFAEMNARHNADSETMRTLTRDLRELQKNYDEVRETADELNKGIAEAQEKSEASETKTTEMSAKVSQLENTVAQLMYALQTKEEELIKEISNH